MSALTVPAGAVLVCTLLAPLGGATPQRPTTAQEPPSPRTDRPQAATPAPVADETFDLDIAERRIRERDFSAATSVAIQAEQTGGVDLGVGAEVRAGEIDVSLRNVRGRVRFRGDLDSVLRRLGRRPAEPSQPR